MDDPQRAQDADESACLQRAREGDAAAIEALYLRFEAPLRRYLERKSGPAVTRAVSLSDLCQDTFLQALDALRVLQPHATFDDFRGVLFRHALWMLGKHLERHRDFVGESVLGERAALDQTPAREHSRGELTRVDEIEWVRGLLERIDPEQAAVMRLRFAGKSFAEIAQELGVREGTARQRFLRGSRELRRMTRLDSEPE